MPSLLDIPEGWRLSYKVLPVDALHSPERVQSRKPRTISDIPEIYESFKDDGIKYPLNVIHKKCRDIGSEEHKKFLIRVGGTRYYCAKLLGMTELPCLILHRKDIPDSKPVDTLDDLLLYYPGGLDMEFTSLDPRHYETRPPEGTSWHKFRISRKTPRRR